MPLAIALIFSLVLTAKTSPLEAGLEILSGRKQDHLWQLEVPDDWVRQSIAISDDTRLPIAEFKTENYSILIHNFPDMKIAPQAQVERWKRQTASQTNRVEPISFSGYQGLMLETNKVIAVALEWGASQKVKGEIASDITFKATSNDPILIYQDEIIQAIRSFEPIDDLCDL